jgi:hypothetical protein
MFKELPPEKVLEVTEGIEDILTPAAKKMMDAMNDRTCPSCGNSLSFYVDANQPFLPSGLPRLLGQCACGYKET